MGYSIPATAPYPKSILRTPPIKATQVPLHAPKALWDSDFQLMLRHLGGVHPIVSNMRQVQHNTTPSEYAPVLNTQGTGKGGD